MKVSRFALLVALLLSTPTVGSEPATALPYLRVSSKPFSSSSIFEVPAKLRPRVDFWKDIFSKYGKQQAVVHHREFPQVVFGVLDFRQDALQLSPRELEQLKESRTKDAFARIRNEIRPLAAGEMPETSYQKGIYERMAFLPGGPKKFQRLLDEPELIRTQTGIKEKFADSIRRSGRYLPIMERIFAEEFDMPIELTRLPFIESSFDYTAYSNVGAAGIWQFMPRTGRLYMMVNGLVDERRDPIESTRAAARYLRDAYSRLGTWPLAITSYNHGVAGVFGKAQRMGTTNLASIIEYPHERVFGFASSNFFPEFLAALEVYDDRVQLFPGLQLERPLSLSAVKLTRPTSVRTVTSTLGVGVSELREANLGISESIWSGKRPIPSGYTLKVPSEFGERLRLLSGAQPVITERAENLPVRGSELIARGDRELTDRDPPPPARSSSTQSSASNDGKSQSTVHKVKKGETLAAIAKRYNLSISTLKDLNGLKKGTVRTGQMLVVRRAAPSASQKTKAQKSTERSKAVVAQHAAQAKFTYVVRKGDTLWTIAKKFKRDVSDLKRANNLWSGKVSAGQRVVIPPK